MKIDRNKMIRNAVYSAEKILRVKNASQTDRVFDEANNRTN